MLTMFTFQFVTHSVKQCIIAYFFAYISRILLFTENLTILYVNVSLQFWNTFLYDNFYHKCLLPKLKNHTCVMLQIFFLFCLYICFSFCVLLAHLFPHLLSTSALWTVCPCFFFTFSVHA